MFKLESYIAPIILSYVDKYIKNFRPQDSQLSLWGGDASFHNLDLRLEVLEQELQLPFSFVSGHIHELLLHVPWTKLASEPITVTINTIECILKLKGADAGNTDLSNQVKERQRKSANKRQEMEAPPGYVQSLINKIVSNIKIYCNNLILKYVEEDIVVSMNVKFLTFESANERWEPAYIDTSSTQVTLRKLITVSDLTVCLDKRNAAGKIDVYQEPVLYRCSLTVHMLRQYYSPSAKRASTTRIDVYCNNMEFSMTEQQVPMLLRVAMLLYALQQRQLKSETEISGTTLAAADSGELTETPESWAGWAWSFVPSIIPTSWDDTYNEQYLAACGHVFHVGFYVDNASLTFKVSESNNERSAYYNQRKIKYLPLLTLRLQGLFMESVSNNTTWFQCTSGISQIILLPVGQCSCAYMEVSETEGLVQPEYLKLGLTSTAHKSNSLFDLEAAENKGQNRPYNTSWDFHLTTVTEETLLERTPAFATDYLYTIEISDDLASDRLSELGSDLEYSNLHERSLLRVVAGAGRLRVCSGFFHRINSLRMAASAYDYPPYKVPRPDPLLSELPPPCAEDFDALSDNIPSREMQVTIFSPVIEFQMMDHPYFEPTKKNLYRKRKKVSTSLPSPGISTNSSVELPKLTLECQCIDVKFYYPMYVKRLVHTVCQLPDPPGPMFDACHITKTIRVMGISSRLFVSAKKHTTILMPSSASLNYKTIIKPLYWTDPDIPHKEITFESESISITGTKAKFMLIYQIIDKFNSRDGSNTINLLASDTLRRDAGRSFGMPYLELYIEGLRYKTVTTNCTVTTDASLGAIRAFIYEPILETSPEKDTVSVISDVSRYSEGSRQARAGVFSAKDILQVLFVSGPEIKAENSKNAFSDTPLLTATIQFPLNPENQPHPPILAFDIQETRICIDPALCRWLLYEPRVIHKKTEFFDPQQRKNRNISEASGSILETPRRVGTQLESIHSSSDKEHVNNPAPLQRFTKETEALDLQERIYIFLKKYFGIWKSMLLNGEISQCTIYFPVESLSAIGSQGIQEAVLKALKKEQPPEILILSLPIVTVCNASHRQKLSNYMTHLPIKLPQNVWSISKSGFPWIISVSDMNCYTIQNKKKLNFLEPLFLTATIGVSTKSANPDIKYTKSDESAENSNLKTLKQLKTPEPNSTPNISTLYFGSKIDFGSLGICVHVDMSSVTLSISEVQMCLIASILFGLSEVINTLTPETVKETPKSPDVMQNILGWSSTMSPTLIRDSTVESISEQTPTAVMSGSENDSIKLTAWIQWTIARFRIKLLSHDAREISPEENYLFKPNIKLIVDAEDIVSSVDFQSVYVKIKSKIANATIQHFKRKKESPVWIPGDFLGLVMRSKDDPSSIERREDIGFATVTITRASCQHTHALWGAAQKEKLKENKASVIDFQTPSRYITEIVITSQPIDFIVSLNILQSFFMIMEPLLEISTTKESKSGSWLFRVSNENLPLIYVECQGIRLIVPSVELGGTGAEHDVCIFQVDAINLMPSAINPICRSPCRPDIYQFAAQSRILNIPGSEVEDRQYQFDVTGMSINTGTWLEVDSILNSQSNNFSNLKTMSENPALEWNNLDKGQLSVTPHLNIWPVINKFDLSVVVAPAMIYKTNTLVCGHSIEINCVSDVEVNLSLSQIQLSSTLLTEFLQLFKPMLDTELVKRPKVKFPYPKFDLTQFEFEEQSTTDFGLDSGIETAELQSSFSLKTKESTTEAAHADITKRTLKSFESEKSFGVFPRPPNTLPPAHHNIPVDLLLTGGKIALILYKLDRFYGKSKLKQKDKKHKPILKIVDQEEGYEGSEEGSVDDKNMLGLGIKQFQPLVFLSVSQPNAFLSRFYLGRKIQLSCYDVRMKISGPEYLSLKTIPTEDDFPINLLETKPGMPNPSTGIFPAFFTLKWSKGIGKPATVSVDIARPTRILCSITRWNYLLFIKDKVADSFKSSFDTLSSGSKCNKANSSFTFSDEVQKHATETYTKFKQIKKQLYGVSSLSLSLAQLLLVVKTDNNPEVNINISKLKNNLNLSYRPEKLTNTMTLESITIGISKDNVTRLLLNPWTVTLETSLFWESWQSTNSNPQIQASVISDCIVIDVSPDQIRCMEMVIKDLTDFFSNLCYESASELPTSNDTLIASLHSDREQHYKDDLRAGAFQFIDATTNKVDELPLPYQVMFWNKKIAAMAWRYPQPRTLTKVRVFPVPFKLTTRYSEEDNYEIMCHLEYWSECHRCYQPFVQFLLSENEVNQLQLPENSVRAVASVWRVVLSTHDDGQVFDLDRSKVSISPRALAACMRIDSYFNKVLIPDLSLSLDISTINIALYNNFNKNSVDSLPGTLKQYTWDTLMPDNHCFLILTLSNSKTYLSTWNFESVSFDTTTTVQCSVLDYAFLSQQTLLDPCSLRTEINFTKYMSVDVISKPFNFKIGPSIAHTLTVNMQMWEQTWNDNNRNNSTSLIIMTHYVICNDTNINIRFGQMSTNEDILLLPRHCHLYSWRSQKSKPSIRLGLEESSWDWSRSFQIDNEGTEICDISTEQHVSVVVTVKNLSATQKKVTFTGQLIICNTLLEHFELKAVPIVTEDKDKEFKKAASHIITGKTTAPSLLLNANKKYHLRLRFFGLDSAWSGDIPLVENSKCTQPWLVKVPLQEKGQFLSIWCRIVVQHFKNCTQTLAILWPLFMVRSNLAISAKVHIETPMLNVHIDSTVQGRGEFQQLYCPGTIDHSHQLSFQLDNGTPTLNPYVPLNYSLVDQKQFFKRSETETISETLEIIENYDKSSWPYFGEDLEGIDWIVEEQPLTHVQVRYQNACRHSSALLVELLPWSLLINIVGCPIAIIVNEKELCRISHHGIITPPKLEENFHLSIKISNTWYVSLPLQLAKSEWSQTFYMPKITGTIPLEGSIRTAISSNKHICMLSITSTFVNEIRLLKVSSSHVVTNHMSMQIHLACIAVPESESLHTAPKDLEKFSFTVSPHLDKINAGVSIMQWSIVGKDIDFNSTFALYIIVSFDVKFGWSCPVRVDKGPVRRNIAVQSECHSIPIVVTVQEYKGQAYIALHHDLHPQMLIENKSDAKLFFAQFNNESNSAIDDCSHLKWTCEVDENKTCYYTMPGYSEKFPDLSHNFIETMVIATDPQSDPRGFQWSHPLNIIDYHDQFVRVPFYGDVKITIIHSSHTSFITIESASQVEINARDIRVRLFMHENESSTFSDNKKTTDNLQDNTLYSNLKNNSNVSIAGTCRSQEETSLALATAERFVSNVGPNTPHGSYGFKTLPTLAEHSTGNVLSAHASGSSFMEAHSKQSSDVHISSSILTRTLPMRKDWTSFKISVFSKGVNVILHSDFNSSDGGYKEVCNLSCDDIVLTVTQTDNMEVNLSISEIQFDNQMYSRGGFDFPVVLIGQEVKAREVLRSFSDRPTSQWIALARRSPLFSVELIIETWKDVAQNKNITEIKDLKINIQPISTYIEDVYITKLTDYLLMLFPSKLVLWPIYPKNVNYNLNSSLVGIPEHITWESAILARPLTLKTLCIEPLSLLLSVHSSVKLYIALDQSPLHFGKFDRKRLLTTPYRLGNVLTMHYLSGAIFGAGWVVGSLELLGSPGGLARAMGSGLKDFVRLPYRGLIQGPWAFLRGVTHGSASLMRHVTAGTLQSVTKLASSVARNLDRLTLDEEHLRRTEEQRRQRPQGLTQGFIQGLTGLGISLLGAVGGIAHHPLQSVMEGASPRGLAAGVGLGLVGVITKPLSGAADLLALTGQGLLQGAGWNPLPEPRSEPVMHYIYSSSNSILKYKWKFMQAITQSNLLFATDATWVTVDGHYEAVTLILTTDGLIIINTEEDTIQKMITLPEISNAENSKDPTLLNFKLTPAAIATKNQGEWIEMDPACRARVADYVQSTVGLLQFPDDLSPEPSDISISPCPTPTSTSQIIKQAELVFYINSQHKNYFITLLRLLKEQNQNYNFPIL